MTMSKDFFATIVGAICTLCASASFAGSFSLAPADDPVVSPAPVPAVSWAGGYAGVQSGYLSAKERVDLNTAAGATIERWNPDLGGATAGIYAGYNWQTQRNFLFGVEAEYNWANASGSDTIFRSNTQGNATENVESNIDTTAAIRARFGYAFDRTLLYATAGWARASFGGRVFSTFNGSPSGNTASWSDSASGWTAGIGIERAFNDRWVARIDYRYSDFGNIDYAPIGTAGASFSGELNTSEIRLGAAMRF